MADSSTTHLNLIKQDLNAAPDFGKENDNLDALDAEVWARGKTFNGEPVGEDGGFHVDRVPYAENLDASATQKVNGSFIIRTTGESSSTADGDAWLNVLRGTRTHTGYVPQSVEMTVTPAQRTEGDPITATIDEDTFIAYVQQTSGTITLIYSVAWSASPALYGITVSGTPVSGDTITVEYQKEVRGTITQSTPTSFRSTGWNLYNHTNGYAHLPKYNEDYGYKISGTYTALEFATTVQGARTTITPVSGSFTIPSDGYVFVTGGNGTDTAIWATWADWTEGYNWNSSTGTQGAFEAYTENGIDFSSLVGTGHFFPYGLLQAGTVQDEINFTLGIATKKVNRLAYSVENLASAKASGRQYEYDTNYIYIELETPSTSTFSINNNYIACDHGEEYFTDTAQAVYAQTIYGANLRNKLERDVVSLNQGTSNAGKFLIVGSDGVVVPTTVPFAAGVSF